MNLCTYIYTYVYMEGLIDVGFFHFFLWVGNVAILDARHVLVDSFFVNVWW